LLCAALRAVVSTLAGHTVWAVGDAGTIIINDNSVAGVSPGTWRVFYPADQVPGFVTVSLSITLRALAAVDSYLYAVGDSGTVMQHFMSVSARWGWAVTTRTAGVSGALRGVAGSAANDWEGWPLFVVAVGDNGVILHLVGDSGSFVEVANPEYVTRPAK
jgi:hypothetical protein